MVDLVKKKFDEYLHLNYVTSRNDPDEEPFKTKYEARKLIEDLIGKLDHKLENTSGQDASTFVSCSELVHSNRYYEYFCSKIDPSNKVGLDMTAKSYLISKLLKFYLAKNFIETEEIETGEKMIENMIAELVKITSDESVYNPLLFSLKLSCFNELIFVWSHRADYKKSLRLVLQIDLIYEVFTKESRKHFFSDSQEMTMPFKLDELIVMSKDLDQNKRCKAFEALYTHSLFFFAQIYGKLDEKEKSAYYCRLTLQRQLDQFNEKINEKEDESSDYNNEKVFF